MREPTRSPGGCAGCSTSRASAMPPRGSAHGCGPRRRATRPRPNSKDWSGTTARPSRRRLTYSGQEAWSVVAPRMPLRLSIRCCAGSRSTPRTAKSPPWPRKRRSRRELRLRTSPPAALADERASLAVTVTLPLRTWACRSGAAGGARPSAGLAERVLLDDGVDPGARAAELLSHAVDEDQPVCRHLLEQGGGPAEARDQPRQDRIVAERRWFVELRAAVGDGGELGEVPGRGAGESEGVDRDQPVGREDQVARMDVGMEVCPFAAMFGRAGCERGRQPLVAVLDLGCGCGGGGGARGGGPTAGGPGPPGGGPLPRPREPPPPAGR